MSDNGFLKLDNAIIDYWMSKLNHSEFKTLLTVYRKTVGWSKQYDRISQTQIAELSGITTRSVRSAITSLEDLGLIVTTGKNKSAKVFTLNTDTLFNVCLKSDDVIEMESKLYGLEIDSKNLSSECNNSEKNDLEFDNNFRHKRHSKDTNNRKVKYPSSDVECTNKTDTSINIPFSDFWEKYDYCKGKKSDVKAKWEALSDEERTLTMQSLDTYLLSTPDKTYRKYPMSYLNTEAWNDEHIVPTGNQDIAQSSEYNPSDAHNNKYNTDKTKATKNTNDVYSASFKPFDTEEGNRTKDDLECNLGALGINSANPTVSTTTVNSKSGVTDTNNKHSVHATDNTVDKTVDVVALSSQVHWSELKDKGLLKKKVNPDAVEPNTDTDKMINDFLARNSSKRFCKDVA